MPAQSKTVNNTARQLRYINGIRMREKMPERFMGPSNDGRCASKLGNCSVLILLAMRYIAECLGRKAGKATARENPAETIRRVKFGTRSHLSAKLHQVASRLLHKSLVKNVSRFVKSRPEPT